MRNETVDLAMIPSVTKPFWTNFLVNLTDLDKRDICVWRLQINKQLMNFSSRSETLLSVLFEVQ